MALFDQAIPKLLAKEGGDKVTEIKGDNGGLTKYGISQRSYPRLDIRNLSEDEAKHIYLTDYWEKISGAQITSQIVSELIFESAVNSGVLTTVKLVQIAIGVEVDGVIGAHTLAAINAADEKSFIALFRLALIARYVHICNKDNSQNKFLLGWMNRVLGGV